MTALVLFAAGAILLCALLVVDALTPPRRLPAGSHGDRTAVAMSWAVAAVLAPLAVAWCVYD